MITTHNVWDIGAGVVVGSSLLNSFLPPYEDFADYPRFQKAYKFATIFIVRFASVNLKSVVYPRIQATAQDALKPKGGIDAT